ncbi:gp436 family protein [Enterobacter asburiae]
MTYATPEDYIAYFTERDATGVSAKRGVGAPDTTRIARHLQSASDRIDSYLGARYTLPLVDVPGALRDYCCDIARFLMVGTEHSTTEEMRIRYDDAIAWLKRVADGKITLGSAPGDGQTVEPSSPDVVFYCGGEDLWSRNRTGGGCY